MRSMLARGILVVAMLGVAGPLVCDSGCVAGAEDSRPVLKKSDFLRTPADHVPEEHNPDVERERRREFRRGDFWPRKDFDRAFLGIDRFQGFEPVVPPGR